MHKENKYKSELKQISNKKPKGSCDLLRDLGIYDGPLRDKQTNYRQKRHKSYMLALQATDDRGDLHDEIMNKTKSNANDHF